MSYLGKWSSQIIITSDWTDLSHRALGNGQHRWTPSVSSYALGFAPLEPATARFVGVRCWFVAVAGSHLVPEIAGAAADMEGEAVDLAMGNEVGTLAGL